MGEKSPLAAAMDDLFAPLNHLVCPCGAQLTTASQAIAEKWIDAHVGCRKTPPPQVS